MRRLSIYWDGRLVGHFLQDEAGIGLQYAPEWLAAGGNAISLSLPPRSDLIRTPAVAWFIGNLLPEGAARESLDALYKLDSTDDFGLLGRLGAECAGALSILPEGEQPPPDDAAFETLYEPAMDSYELGQLIQAFAAAPTMPFKGHRLRLSLAGVQRKFTLARFDGHLHRSYGGATTHIVKPDIALVRGEAPAYPGMVFNEYCCARLAQACGLDAATVELQPYTLYRDGEPQYAYLTERFDRRVLSQGRVARLHQEDFCQALGLDRRRKYEDEQSGVTLADLFGFIRDSGHLDSPAAAQRQLLTGILFNVLIGNGDAHAKNYALLRDDAGIRIAPLYDLLCTQAYANVNNFFAQKIGQARRFAELRWSDFALLESALGIRQRAIVAAGQRLATSLLRELPRLQAALMREPYWNLARPIVERIADIATARALALLRMIDAHTTGRAETGEWTEAAFERAAATAFGTDEPARTQREHLRRLLADNGGRLHAVDREQHFPQAGDAPIQALEAAFQQDSRRAAERLIQ
jgi:serine/threonine-protein kinase HipA